MKKNKSINPLTGLPGNWDISRQLESIIGDPEKLTVYLDITDFKPYNEVYGFTAGDNVILSVAEILRKICNRQISFLGHIGGDDFVIIINKKVLSNLFKWIDREFLTVRNSFYHQCDISRGFTVGWDRKGERTRFPLMGICGVAFSPYAERFNTARQISEYATHLKEASKSKRTNDNIFITPKDLNILPVPLKDFILDKNVPIFKRRTVIEAMGETGLIHNGRILVEVLNESIPVLLKKSLIFSLGRLRYTPAEKILLEFTEHINPHLRTRAVEAIGHIGGSKHLRKIGEMVTDPNPYVSVMAVKSLANIGHPDGLKFLRDISVGSRWLKIEAVITRSILGDKSAADELKTLINDPNPVFRKRAAGALELVPSMKCVEILYKAIKGEEDFHVKNSFIISLGRIAQKLSFHEIGKVSSWIWEIYINTPCNIKPYLLPSIGKCRIKEAKKILRKKVGSISELERYLAIEGLVYYNNPGHIYLIRKALTDSAPMVRARSARALGEIKDVEGMEFLRLSLKDSNELVRKKAAESILKMAADSYLKQGKDENLAIR